MIINGVSTKICYGADSTSDYVVSVMKCEYQQRTAKLAHYDKHSLTCVQHVQCTTCNLVIQASEYMELRIAVLGTHHSAANKHSQFFF